jgi:hypothetical protein
VRDQYGNIIVEGQAYVFLGSSSGPGHAPVWTGQGLGQFGSSVSGAGDVNGDRFADVIVGAQFFSAGQDPVSKEGAAYVYAGSNSGPGTSPVWTAVGDQAGAFFGASVAGAGDVNGDGFADIAVGARLYSKRVTLDSRTDEGRAFLYLGSATGPAPSPAWSAFGDQPGGQFGFSVAAAGDVNGDGFGDLVVGQESYSNGQYEEGRLLLYYGSSSGTLSTPGWMVESEQPPAKLGFSVASAGDVNGDGLADLVAGADWYPNGQDLVGAALLFLGSPSENRSPAARAGVDSRTECASPAGATVALDGSASFDLNSTPGTDDDIVSYEWIEFLGQPAQRLLGSGRLLQVGLPLGEHLITLRVTDRAGATGIDEVNATVVDTEPPRIAVSATPSVLWPPNHRMVNVPVMVWADDACGTPLITPGPVTSNEPDDAPSRDDGATVGDMEVVGTGETGADLHLRAERGDAGTGRIYTVSYTARDVAGNVTSAVALLAVPHDDLGVTEPIMLDLSDAGGRTHVEWMPAPRALRYDLIRGDVATLRETNASIDLGAIACVAGGLVGTTTLGYDDSSVPPAGAAFFYLVEYDDGLRSSFGTVSASKPRIPGSGGCPP